MAYERAFDDCFPHTITIEPVLSRDEYNARTYGTVVSYSARVVEIQERVIAFDGRETMSTHVIWVSPNVTSGIPDVGPDARVTLPDGTTPPVLNVFTYPDDEGDHHMKIVLGARLQG